VKVSAVLPERDPRGNVDKGKCEHVDDVGEGRAAMFNAKRPSERGNCGLETADLGRKKHKGMYEKIQLTSCTVIALPNRDTIQTCEGPCTTCATWSDNISEVTRVCGVGRHVLGDPRLFDHKDWDATRGKDLAVRGKGQSYGNGNEGE